jgi:hypothetical protein
MVNELFDLDEGELVINRQEVNKIEEYKALLKRDTGSLGDLSGRKGLIATGELYYIYLIYDVRSLYYNLDKDTREKNARIDSKLPDNWKPDKVFNQAIDRYCADRLLSSAGNAYYSSEKALYSMSEDVKNMLDNTIELKREVEVKIKKLSKTVGTRAGEEESKTFITEYAMLLLQLTKVQKEIISTIKELPALGDTVKKLANRFTEEGGKIKTPIGGGELGNREE